MAAQRATRPGDVGEGSGERNGYIGLDTKRQETITQKKEIM